MRRGGAFLLEKKDGGGAFLLEKGALDEGAVAGASTAFDEGSVGGAFAAEGERSPHSSVSGGKITCSRGGAAFAAEGDGTRLGEKITCSRGGAAFAAEGDGTRLGEKITCSRGGAAFAAEGDGEAGEKITCSRGGAAFAKKEDGTRLGALDCDRLATAVDDAVITSDTTTVTEIPATASSKAAPSEEAKRCFPLLIIPHMIVAHDSFISAQQEDCPSVRRHSEQKLLLARTRSLPEVRISTKPVRRGSCKELCLAHPPQADRAARWLAESSSASSRSSGRGVTPSAASSSGDHNAVVLVRTNFGDGLAPPRGGAKEVQVAGGGSASSEAGSRPASATRVPPEGTSRALSMRAFTGEPHTDLSVDTKCFFPDAVEKNQRNKSHRPRDDNCAPPPRARGWLRRCGFSSSANPSSQSAAPSASPLPHQSGAAGAAAGAAERTEEVRTSGSVGPAGGLGPLRRPRTQGTNDLGGGSGKGLGGDRISRRSRIDLERSREVRKGPVV